MQQRNTIRRAAAALIAALCPLSASAATLNFSNIEVALVDPDDYDSMSIALWTGWLTQLYEYNMPFIELANTAENAVPIEQFTMTIGDTGFSFSNEYLNKEWTNSYPFPADGTYAVAGFSTQDIEFTGTVADDGNLLIVDFGDGGLQPGETVRFQVDIDRDAPESGALFAEYTSVFFGNGDETPNSEITLSYAEVEGQIIPNSVITLPDFDTTVDVQTPRPYTVMQPIDVFPDTTIDIIPEPTAALLAMLATIGAGLRRVG